MAVWDQNKQALENWVLSWTDKEYHGVHHWIHFKFQY